MTITLDKLCNVVTFVPDLKRNTEYHGKKPDFKGFVKSTRANKKIKRLTNFMYETKGDKRFYFVTVTTQQHKSGLSDLELYRAFGLWLKRQKGSQYVCICERQKTTRDLHFHVLLCTDKRKPWSYAKEIRYLADKFNAIPHPALFDVKEVRERGAVGAYLRKYFTKGANTDIFGCRTFSYSLSLARDFREQADKFVLSFRSGTAGYSELVKHFAQQKLQYIGGSDFFSNFRLRPSDFGTAQQIILSNNALPSDFKRT